MAAVSQWPGLRGWGWRMRRVLAAGARRFGLWGAGVAALCAVGLAAAAVAQLQQRRAEALDRQQAMAIRLRAAASALPALLPQDGVPQSDGLQAFDAQLLAHDAIAQLVQDVLLLGEEAGLQARRGDYQVEVDPLGGFLRYRMSLPVQGPAAAVHGFMRKALMAQKSLALEHVQFKRASLGADTVQAQIRWVVFVRRPQGDGMPASPSAQGGPP